MLPYGFPYDSLHRAPRDEEVLSSQGRWIDIDACPLFDPVRSSLDVRLLVYGQSAKLAATRTHLV